MSASPKANKKRKSRAPVVEAVTQEEVDCEQQKRRAREALERP
jgi:hypothetical protein